MYEPNMDLIKDLMDSCIDVLAWKKRREKLYWAFGGQRQFFFHTAHRLSGTQKVPEAVEEMRVVCFLFSDGCTSVDSGENASLFSPNTAAIITAK